MSRRCSEREMQSPDGDTQVWGARRQGDFRDLQVGLDSTPWYVAARRMKPVPLSVPNNVPGGGI